MSPVSLADAFHVLAVVFTNGCSPQLFQTSLAKHTTVWEQPHNLFAATHCRQSLVTVLMTRYSLFFRASYRFQFQ